MSLHPIDGRKSRRSTGLRLQRQRIGYHATSREWNPRNYYIRNNFGGWGQFRDSVLSVFSKKWIVVAIVIVFALGSLNVMYNDPNNSLFHSYQPGPWPCEKTTANAIGATCHDPTSLIWGEQAGDLSDFNTIGATWLPQANCIGEANQANNECVRLVANSTNSALMLSKSSIDFSKASAKTLAFNNNWAVSISLIPYHKEWGFYLSTSPVLPTAQNYNPINDPSVVFDTRVWCNVVNGCLSTVSNSTTQYQSEVLMLNTIGKNDTIANELTGSCGGSATGATATPSSCFLLDNRASLSANSVGGFLTPYLNFTGTGAGHACTIIANVVSGDGCSWLVTNPQTNTNNPTVLAASTTQIPWWNFQSQRYFIGFYAVAGLSFQVQFSFNGQSFIGCCNMDSYTILPNNAVASTPPVIDTGGWIGTALGSVIGGLFPGGSILVTGWGVLANVTNQAGTNIFATFVSGLQTFASLIVQGFKTLGSWAEGFLAAILNAVGSAFGFPGTSVNCGVAGGQCAMGDLVFLVVTQIISFVTGTINTLLAQLGPLFTGLSNAFGVFVNWIAEAFTFLTDLLSFASGIAVFAFGMFTLGTKFGSFGIGLWLFIFFFAFNADDGMRGWIRWFNFSKWLIFDIGVNWTMQGINFLIDVMLFFIGLIPKPFIQMSVGKVPRLPLLEIHGSFDIPDFSGQALREGNLFSIIGFLGGFTGLVFFETTSLPGALGSLPGTVFNAQALANMSVAVTFYKLFFPLVILVVFMLIIPTVFSSIFGYHVVGTGIPVSVSRGRGSVGPSVPSSRLGFSKRTTRISRHLETKGKRVSGEEAARKAAESLRNRNEEARRVAENEKAEIERLKREAQDKQRQERESVETSLGDT